MTRPLILLALLAGCATTVPVWKSPVVDIQTRNGRGQGVAISCSKVVTVYHVVKDGPAWVTGIDGKRYPLKQHAWVPSTYENLIILTTKAPLPPPITMRQMRHGDSGSPVIVDKWVVGFVHGWWQDGTIIVLPVWEASEILKRLREGRFRGH